MKKNYFDLKKILDFRALLIFTFIVMSTNEVYSQYTETFSSSTTWTCPPNVSSIQVKAYGGGGG
ncbi:MAG TPA: hypothetical protein PKN96_02820, partial [Flavobacterium sp.]|uniref:hypothetical protein n=1 Tax=Flavobacterium sp. TaxID=239 RepID=UPI002D08509B